MKRRAFAPATEPRAFFDRLASEYADAHKRGSNALESRVSLLARLLGTRVYDSLMELGCGPADHLRALASRYRRGIGADFSEAMVKRARRESAPYPGISIIRDDAESLYAFADNSLDAVICVGVLEHVPSKHAVFRAVSRVLAPGGCFVGLTVNGGYLWHRFCTLSGYPNRHLSTDRFLRAAELRRLAAQKGFGTVTVGAWSFVPAGDVPHPIIGLLYALDRIGAGSGVTALRGGLWFRAVL